MSHFTACRTFMLLSVDKPSASAGMQPFIFISLSSTSYAGMVNSECSLPSCHRCWPGWTCTQLSMMAWSRSLMSRDTQPSATLSESDFGLHSVYCTHSQTHEEFILNWEVTLQYISSSLSVFILYSSPEVLEKWHHAACKSVVTGKNWFLKCIQIRARLSLYEIT